MDALFNATGPIGAQVGSFSSMFSTLAEKLKPLNLRVILRDFQTAKSHKTRIGCVIRILELYDIYWKPLDKCMKHISNMLIHAVKFIITRFPEITDFLGLTVPSDQANSRFMPGDAQQVPDGPLRNQSGPGVAEAIANFLKFIGLKVDIGSSETLHSILCLLIPFVLLALTFSGITTNIGLRLSKSIIAAGALIRATSIVSTSFNGLYDMIRVATAAAFGIELSPNKKKLADDLDKLGIMIDEAALKLRTDPAGSLGDPHFIPLITTNLDQVQRFFNDVSKSGENLSNMRVRLNTLETEARALKRAYNEICDAVAGKQHPTCLYLWGNPGVGKSRLCQHISDLLSSPECEGRRQLCFTRTNEQFWSGYCNQDIVIYDDFNQRTDCKDHEEIFTIVTDQNLPLNMAHLEDKGRKYTSRYLFLCSNDSHIITSQKINNLVALNRRRDFLVRVQDPIYEAEATRGQTAHRDDNYSHLILTLYEPLLVNGECRPILDDNGQPKTITLAQLAKSIYEQQEARREDFKRSAKRKLDQLNQGPVQRPPVVVPPNLPIIQEEAQPINLADIQFGDIDTPNALTQDEREELRRLMNNPARDPFANQAIVVPMYLILGPPGVWKSSLGTQNYFDDVPGFEFMDEIALTEDSLKAAVERVWKPQANKTLVMTANPTSLDSMFKKVYPNDSQKYAAFMRRVITANFTFRRKWNFRRYTRSDIDSNGVHSNFDKIVKITVTSDHHQSTDLTYRELIKFIKGQKLIEFDSELELTLAEVPPTSEFDLMASTHLSTEDMVRPGAPKFSFEDFKLVKGTMLQALTKVSRFIGDASKHSYRSVSDAMMAFNDRRIKDDTTILVAFADKSFYFSPSGGYSVVRLVNNDLARQVLENGSLEGIWDRFSPYIEALSQIIRGGVGYYFTCDFESDRMGHEAWADDVDERMLEDPWNWDAPYNPGKKLPKAALPMMGKRVEMYCPIHHKVDTCLHVESSTVRVKRVYGNDTPVDERPIPLNIEGYSDYTEPQRAAARFVVQPTPERRRENELSREGYSDYTEPQRAAQRFVVPPTGKKKEETFESHATSDMEANSLVLMIAKNTVYVGSYVRPQSRAVMIKGRIGVCNYHVTYNGEIGDSIQIAYGRDKETVGAIIVKVVKNRDLAYFKLPDWCPQFRDITSHMRKKKDVISVFGYPAFLNIMNPTGFIVQRLIRIKEQVTRDVEGMQRDGILYRATLNNVSFDPIGTQPGDCGSSVVLIAPGISGKFIAIHGAGNMSEGLGALVFVDDLIGIDDPEPMRTESVVVKDDIHILTHQCIQPVEVEDHKLFKVIGVCHDGEKPIPAFHPHDTHLWKSPLNGFTPPMYEPCVLSKHDLRNTDPNFNFYQDAIEKWSHEQPENVDIPLLEMVTEATAEYLAQKVQQTGLSLKICTKTEAINGVAGFPCSNPIYRHSSAGYPFSKWPKVTNKDTFFEQKEDGGIWTFSKHPDSIRLNTAIDALIQTAREGKRSAVVFSGTIKDEPVKLKKIYDVNYRASRSFAGSPLDFTLAHRMYLHTVGAALSHLHSILPIKIGIDPASTEWHTLYHYHTEVSDRGFDVDFSQWDSTVPSVFMKKCAPIYNRIYQLNDPNWKPEDDHIRTHLLSCVDKPLITYYDYVVQCPGGQVSGQPFTSLDNCIINMLYNAYVFIKLARVHCPRKATYKAWLENVRMSCYGDDLLTTVSLDCLPWFNFRTFCDETKLLNLKATPPTKVTGEMIEHKHILEMTFLKRTFEKHGAYYLGGLLDECFSKMLDWTTLKKKHYIWQDKDTIRFDSNTIQSTVDSALKEGAIRGSEFYNRLVSHFRKCDQEFQIGLNYFPTWDEVMTEQNFKVSAPNATPCVLKSEKFEQNLEVLLHQSGFDRVRTYTKNNVKQRSSSTDSRSSRGWSERGFSNGLSNSDLWTSVRSNSRNWRSSSQNRTSEFARPVSVQPVHLHEQHHVVNNGVGRNRAVVHSTAPK